MPTRQWITEALSPKREARIQSMLSEVNASKKNGHRAGDEAIAYTAGFIAVSNEGALTLSTISERTERDYSVVKRAATALHTVGFIDTSRTSDFRAGRPATIWIPRLELYEGIAISPDWQAAAGACLLAVELELTVPQAIRSAVTTSLEEIGADIPIPPHSSQSPSGG
jgi:hypothetical protein